MKMTFSREYSRLIYLLQLASNDPSICLDNREIPSQGIEELLAAIEEKVAEAKSETYQQACLRCFVALARLEKLYPFTDMEVTYYPNLAGKISWRPFNDCDFQTAAFQNPLELEMFLDCFTARDNEAATAN